MVLILPSIKPFMVESHRKLMAGWWENGYLITTWDHCTEEMNVNVVNPAPKELILLPFGLSS